VLPPSVPAPEQALVHIDVWQLFRAVSAEPHAPEAPVPQLVMHAMSLQAHDGRHW
jgi:hypothetical protein